MTHRAADDCTTKKRRTIARKMKSLRFVMHHSVQQIDETSGNLSADSGGKAIAGVQRRSDCNSVLARYSHLPCLNRTLFLACDNKQNSRSMDAFDRLVIVNRHNAPIPVELSFPLELAIDRPWCELTSRSIVGNGKWEILEATESLADHLPSKAGLYMFVWKIPFSFPTSQLGNHFFRIVK